MSFEPVFTLVCVTPASPGLDENWSDAFTLEQDDDEPSSKAMGSCRFISRVEIKIDNVASLTHGDEILCALFRDAACAVPMSLEATSGVVLLNATSDAGGTVFTFDAPDRALSDEADGKLYAKFKLPTGATADLLRATLFYQEQMY